MAQAQAAAVVDHLHRRIEGHIGHPLGAQHPRDDLAHAPHAGDHDARLLAVDALVLRWYLHRRGFRLEQVEQDEHQQRGDGHRQGDGEHQQVMQARFEQALIAGQLEHHEGELAPGRQDDAQAHRIGALQSAAVTADQEQQRQLDQHQKQGQADDHQWFMQQQAEVGGHAHADEEQAEQQTLEGLDLGFEFVAVFGVGQQQAGDEGAERHGHPGQLHQPGGAYDHQQCGGGGDFLQAGLGDDAEHGPQQIAPADDHCAHAAHHLEQVHQGVAVGFQLIGAGDHRQQGYQRDGGDVLEQQDGEGQAAMGAGQLLALGEHLQAEGRG
ncbi:hypothetical protein FQZ97_811290 [compost metagenome]